MKGWNGIRGERLGRESQHKTLAFCPALAWLGLDLPSVADTTQGTEGAGTFLRVGKLTGVARTRRSGTDEEGGGELHCGLNKFRGDEKD